MQTNITILPIPRRRPGCWAFLAAVLLGASLPAFANDGEWKQYKQQFIDPSGRVVDAAQGNVSHSEGQGFAMLLATHYRDRAAFELVWRWTKQHLAVRDDHLMAWRWSPQAGVADKNNASDGDLVIAWALLRAYDQWHAPEYLEESRNIARDIRAKLLRNTTHGLILLPGAQGFEKPEGITINLSYWVFPALRELGRADPAPEWDTLTKSGITILQYAHFGRWGLPPDWLVLDQKVAPAENFPARFGYDAVRVPLYLLWGGHASPALLKPYLDFWGYFEGSKFLPAWTNLKDDSVDSYDASPGIREVARWVLASTEAARVPPPANGTTTWQLDGYYSAALLLLTEMASSERGRTPRPN